MGRGCHPLLQGEQKPTPSPREEEQMPPAEAWGEWEGCRVQDPHRLRCCGHMVGRGGRAGLLSGHRCGTPRKSSALCRDPPAAAVNPSSTQMPSGREDSGGRTLREGSEGCFSFRLNKGLIALICQENDQRCNRKWAKTASVH